MQRTSRSTLQSEGKAGRTDAKRGPRKGTTVRRAGEDHCSHFVTRKGPIRATWPSLSPSIVRVGVCRNCCARRRCGRPLTPRKRSASRSILNRLSSSLFACSASSLPSSIDRYCLCRLCRYELLATCASDQEPLEQSFCVCVCAGACLPARACAYAPRAGGAGAEFRCGAGRGLGTDYGGAPPPPQSRVQMLFLSPLLAAGTSPPDIRETRSGWLRG